MQENDAYLEAIRCLLDFLYDYTDELLFDEKVYLKTWFSEEIGRAEKSLNVSVVSRYFEYTTFGIKDSNGNKINTIIQFEAKQLPEITGLSYEKVYGIMMEYINRKLKNRKKEIASFKKEMKEEISNILKGREYQVWQKSSSYTEL